ncbi:MAG: DUF4301 family protein [Prevotellaceae bacterium]|jgi:hypothetical protein|nr:DUF4301 family protein [Prevotellaceae bacterium]
MLTLFDHQQLQQLGITVEQVEQQLNYFRQGFPFLPITAPATPDNGIIQFSQEEQALLLRRFDQWGGSRLKFVPASGAATRMFKALFEYLEAGKKGKEVDEFFAGLKDFAFYEDLTKIVGENTPKGVSEWVKALLDTDGLNYGNLPKGLLKFHYYVDGARTAFEEHLVEAALYAKDNCGIARLHFTVSPEHRKGFEALLNEVQQRYEQRYDVKYEVSFSEQKKSTDTIAVDLQNEPFRNADGTLLFRPGGHGALLENLDEMQEDIVFIKNIDNITPDKLRNDTIHWKKVLAGYLLQLREQITKYIRELEEGCCDIKLKKIAQFLEKQFCITLPVIKGEEYAHALYAKLNRPIRVCGMVKNEGEPGGGPFIARSADGSLSLQIAESVQIDQKDPEAQGHFKAATHFNPVDLVCSFRDYHGGRYSLPNFCDPATGFISQKSKDGLELKALELPGLWNGAMSNWNTVFVEVPLITFNPVKTINDLLRKEHQTN